MTSRRIVKSDLLKLLPDYDEQQLPQELIALTEAYLSQIKTQYMVQSEEPAKSFVCAHIACEQLSNKFGLPELNISKAPLPKTRYKALHRRIKTGTSLKQIQDSGQSKLESSRRVAKDLATEVCSKLHSVPISSVLSVLDQVLPRYTSTDLRPLVAAIWLLCNQSLEKADDISSAIEASLMKELGITKAEIEREVSMLTKRSRNKGWFDIAVVPKLKLEAPTNRVVHVKMSATAIDYTSPKVIAEYASWEKDMIERLQRKLDQASSA